MGTLHEDVTVIWSLIFVLGVKVIYLIDGIYLFKSWWFSFGWRDDCNGFA
jgi:hypothetical protein